MKYKGTLALALALALLCAAYWGMQWQRGRAAERAREAKRVFSFGPDSIVEIEIDRLDEAPVAAGRKDAGGWAMIKPSPTIVPLVPLWERVAAQLSQLTNERTLMARLDDPAVYGLADPALTVRARSAAGAAHFLRFGSLEPTQNYRYAQLDDGPVFLVTKQAFFELDRPLNDLRNRFLVNDRNAALLRIDFSWIWTGRGSMTMEDPPIPGEESVAVTVVRKDAASPWRMMSPLEATANQELVEELAREIQFAVGENFVDNPGALSAYGLDPPVARITVADENDGADQVILIGEADEASTGRLFAQRVDREAVFRLDAHILSLFPKIPDAFRERRLLTRQAADIAAIEYAGAEGRFLLENDPLQGWQITQPESAPTDQGVVSEFIAALKMAEGAIFREGELREYGLDAPETVITVRMADGGEPGIIRIKQHPTDDAYCYVTQDTGAVLQASRGQIAPLIANIAHFRSRDLFRFPKPQAVKIEFQFEGNGYVLDKVHGKWVVKSPEGKTLGNQSDVLDLLDALSPLFAAGVAVTPEEHHNTGLDRPLFTVYVTTHDEKDPNAKPVRHGPLAIGNPVPGDEQRRYAESASRSGVYRVRRDVIETVRELLGGVRDL